jgi:hypothetical protein
MDADIYAYMDDLTICVDPQHANRITAITVAAFHQIGLHINETKSKLLTSCVGPYTLPLCTHEDVFKVLGVNIARSDLAERKFTEELKQRQCVYFNKLRGLPLHPQILYTMMRICGYPRINYFCCTVDPQFMGEVTMFFDSEVKKIVESIVDPTGNTFVPHETIHSPQGADAPCYTRYRTLLYSATRHMALTDDPDVPRLSLTTPVSDTTTSIAQVDNKWLMFSPTSSLTPAQFSTALAIRLNILPAHIPLCGKKCSCGTIYTPDPQETINHILKCDMASPKTHTYRHNLVRDAIVRVSRSFGITTTSEPTCFVYEHGRRCRPDIMCHTHPMNIVTDVTLIDQESDLTAAENEKKEKHSSACGKQNSLFISFAMYTRGTLGIQAEAFIRTLSRYVQPFQQRTFARTLSHAVETAAAKGRADTLMAAADRLMW